MADAPRRDIRNSIRHLTEALCNMRSGGADYFLTGVYVSALAAAFSPWAVLFGGLLLDHLIARAERRDDQNTKEKSQ